VLLHGSYRSRCKHDDSAAQRALESLETRLTRIKAMHVEKFNAEHMDLPASVILDLLLQKFTINTARLNVPIYKSVGKQ
jgi:hypothetical protein